LSSLREFDAADLLQEAFDELALSRLVLRNSYVYAFYVLDPDRPENKVTGHRRLQRRVREMLKARRNDFEATQSELEMLTENLSEIVARRYMRATCREIRNAKRAATLMRTEFCSTLLRNLAPIIATERQPDGSSFDKELLLEMGVHQHRIRSSHRSLDAAAARSGRANFDEPRNSDVNLPDDDLTFSLTNSNRWTSVRAAEDAEGGDNLVELLQSLMQPSDASSAGNLPNNDGDRRGGDQPRSRSPVDEIGERRLLQLLSSHSLNNAESGGSDGDITPTLSLIASSQTATALLREEELMNQAIMMSLQASTPPTS
jgi:hypothetical protein